MGSGARRLMELAGEKGAEVPERKAGRARRERKASDAKHGTNAQGGACEPFDEKESIRTLLALGADAAAKDGDGK